ncbi:MAG: hypothetical protein KA138_13045, partial [Saprospiraceae bacterium]|nr:hypothetical protein [Saprospiraceae bacterium]
FAVKLSGMSSAQTIPQPLSNLQLELLKLYARKVSEQDLVQIKLLLGQYFADKASDLADKVWEEKKLTEGKILGKHRRTPYPRK